MRTTASKEVRCKTPEKQALGTVSTSLGSQNCKISERKRSAQNVQNFQILPDPANIFLPTLKMTLGLDIKCNAADLSHTNFFF